ncbi:MAG: 16S rRNA processing protein RimM [Deltaproteobacteria bacterium]|nr:16S rRNA processing protein RimM [Deltaproteobacteria bacterium]
MNSSSSPEGLLLIGRVIKPRGLKGQINVIYFGEGGKAFSPGQVIYIQDLQGGCRPFSIILSRLRRNVVTLALQGMDRIEEAQGLMGRSVYVTKESLESLPPGEYYWYQLLGLTVKTEEGKELGRLEEILPTGSNDVFVIRREGREVLIPAIEEVIVRINLAEGTMVIRPMGGLLPEDDL